LFKKSHSYRHIGIPVGLGLAVVFLILGCSSNEKEQAARFKKLEDGLAAQTKAIGELTKVLKRTSAQTTNGLPSGAATPPQNVAPVPRDKLGRKIVPRSKNLENAIGFVGHVYPTGALTQVQREKIAEFVADEWKLMQSYYEDPKNRAKKRATQRRDKDEIRLETGRKIQRSMPKNIAQVWLTFREERMRARSERRKKRDAAKRGVKTSPTAAP